MAKDTEKLIRQLSLISYLMAERRPVTALEIRRDVEGYSGMNEDAFARRFYADRAELESLGIQLTVDKPIDAGGEQETYSLRPENFHLPAIAFDDDELAGLHTALGLLDGEFAYAEPLRLALQQITWGRPSPLDTMDSSIALGITGSAGGHELSHRLAKVETAIFRNKTITFDYYTMERDELGARKVDPYHLLFQGGQFYVLGHSHERGALRVFRLSRMRGKVAYASKAEHDFKRPTDFDPRAYADRADWQFGDDARTADLWISDRIAWQVERNFGRFGTVTAAEDGAIVFSTRYANARQLVSWVLRLGEHARVLGPEELQAEMADRVELLAARHEGELELAEPVLRAPRASDPEPERADTGERREAAIRPERFARLVTLASILIAAGRSGTRLDAAELRERLQLSEQELREDLNVLNVVNFGGGSYVLYAELHDDGTIEVDPEPYSDNFDRPARLLPVEAKALVAAIDLIGDHLPEGSLTSRAREDRRGARRRGPAASRAAFAHASGDDSNIARVGRARSPRHLCARVLQAQRGRVHRARRSSPYALINGREGWYVAASTPRRTCRHFRLDASRPPRRSTSASSRGPRSTPPRDVDGWPRTGEVPASRRARVWISPERARWAREERSVAEDARPTARSWSSSPSPDGWLVREVLKEAGDAVVLEPADAREAVLAAALRLRQPTAAR
jgi:proteasome accessory factor C